MLPGEGPARAAITDRRESQERLLQTAPRREELRERIDKLLLPAGGDVAREKHAAREGGHERKRRRQRPDRKACVA